MGVNILPHQKYKTKLNGNNMDCEVCKHFEEHPFARETMDDYCNGYGKWMNDLNDEDIIFCNYFKKENEW